MPDLAATTLETSPSLDICQGFAIIPTLGTLRASVQGSNVQRSLIDVNHITRGIIWAQAKVDWSYFLGICGPAWAMNTEVSGNYDLPDQPATQLNWAGKHGDGSQDGFAGGIQVGLEFSLTWRYYFWTFFTGEIKGDGIFRINLLKTFLDFLIGRASSRGATARGNSNPRPSSQAAMDFDLFLTQNGAWKNGGSISFSPGMEATMNVIDFIPVVNVINRFVQRIGGNVIAGPVLQVGFPITIAPEQIQIGKQAYNNLRFENGRTIGDRNTVGDNPANGDTNLILTIKQSSRIEVAAGIELAVTIGKLFYLGNKWTWSILELLSSFTGINMSLASDYRNDLSNTIGNVNKGFASQGGCGCGVTASRRKVVFGS